MMRSAALLLALGLAIPGVAAAADYRSTRDAATILYDAPSTRARPMFVYGREVPVEVVVSVEGWIKVRDAGGTIGWMPSAALADKRVVEVRVPLAEVRSEPSDASPVVFRAEQEVILEVMETATTAAAVAAPGWLRVRHADGATGYIRLAQVFGF